MGDEEVGVVVSIRRGRGRCIWGFRADQYCAEGVGAVLNIRWGGGRCIWVSDLTNIGGHDKYRSR